MSLFDGYEFESPFLNEALSSSGYSTATGVEEEEDRGYVKGKRNFASNFLSGLYRGIGQTSSIIGKGADLETLENVGSFIQESDFAKPDEAEYFKTESGTRSFVRDIGEGIPITGALAGAAIGGTALAGPLGGMAAFGAVATPLGLGIRDEAISTYFKNNPYGSVEDAENYGTLTALAEVATETLGAAVDYATFKVGGKLTKQALRAGMKSGLIDVDTVVGSIVKKAGPGEFIGKMGFGSAMEGGEEDLNAYLQQATDKAYSVESEEPDYFRTFLLGAVTAAPFNVAGNYVAKKSQDKIRDNLERGLTSDSVEQRKYTADQIYSTMKVASPEAAEAWKDYVDYNVEAGPLALDNKILDGYKWKLNVRKAEEAGLINQITKKPGTILEEAGIPVESTPVASPTDVYTNPVSGTVSNNPYGLSPVEPSGAARPEEDVVGADPATRDIPVIKEETKVADRAKFAFNSPSTEGDVVTKTAQYIEPITARKIEADRAIAADTTAREQLPDNNLPVDYLDPAATVAPVVETKKQTLAQKQATRKATSQQTTSPTVQQEPAEVVQQEPAAPVAQETAAPTVKSTNGVATTTSSVTGAEVPVAEEVANIDEDLRNPETTDQEAVTLIEKKAELLDKTKVVTDTVVPEGPANQVDVAGNKTTVTYEAAGWKIHPQAKNFKSDDGSKASVYINGNAIIARKSAAKVEKGQKKAEQWEAFQVGTDREKVSLGTFKSKKDAVLALSEGKSSDEFYPAKEEKIATSSLAAITPEQQTQLDKAKYKEVVSKAAFKLEVADDPDAITAGLDGAARAVQTYKPEGKTTLRSWIYTQAKGKIQDYKKSKAKTDSIEMQESDTTSVEGNDKTGVIEGVTKRDTQDLIVPADKEKVVEEPPAPVLSLKEIFKKHEVPVEKQESHTKQILSNKLTLEQLDQKLEAEKILDSSKVTGSERLSILKDIKNGDVTVEDVKEAYSPVAPEEPIAEIKEAPTTILRKAAAPIAPEIPSVLAETRVKRDFLDNATTAADLFKMPESFEISGRLKGLRDFLKKVAGTKLNSIRVFDTSEFEERHPAAYARHIEKYGSLPRNFALNKEIYLSKQYESTSKPEAIFRLVLHETVHALTTQGLRSDTKLRAAMQQLLDRTRRELLTPEQLQLLRDKYKFSPSEINARPAEFSAEFPGVSTQTAYALSNVDEFVAEVFNNEELFNKLNAMPMGTRTGMLKTLFDSFVNAIRNFLGLPVNQQSVLADVISVATEVIKPEAAAREQLLDISPSPAGVAVAPTVPIRQDEVDRNRQLNILRKNDTKGKPKEILKEWVKSAGKFAKDILVGVTTRLNEINPNLMKYIRQFEFQIVKYNKKYHDEVRDFIELYRDMKSRDDQIMLDLMLKNSHDPADVSLRNDILKRNGMTEAFKKVQGVLEDIYKRKEKVGLNDYEAFAEYFPRRVKKKSELMAAVRLRGLRDKGKDVDGNFGDIFFVLDQLGPAATEADKEKAIVSMMNTGRRPTIALLKPSSSKERTITKVSSEWSHYYESTVEALIGHIYESNESIEARAMFGDVKRKALVTEDATLRKRLDTEDLSDKTREKLVTRVAEIEMVLKNYEETDEWKDGVATFLAREGINLSEDQQVEVTQLIRSRLTQKGMHGPMAAARNISLAAALGGGLSAITQLGDLMLSINNNGAKSTLEGIFGKKVMTTKDLDLSHSMREFQSMGSTSRLLDSVLKIVQLTRIDQFGKTTFMNAAISKAKGQTIDQFRKEWGEVLGKETEATHADLVAGDKTERVGFFAFNALSEVQPVSMSEMPMAYLGAGNYRIFYALKSYNIKILNMAYKTATTKWKSATNNTERAMAAKDVGKLIILLALGGATADELKDFLMGRETDFSDSMMNNLMKMSFINRYHMGSQGDKAALKTFLTDVLIPPTSVADDAFADLYSFFDDEEGTTYKLLKDMPFGRLLYTLGTDQGKADSFKGMKTDIFEKVKEGAPISDVRKRMTEYNKWARANGETLISYSSLKNAKKKAQK